MTDMDGIDEPNSIGRGLAVGAAITVCTLIMLAVSLSVDPDGIGQRVGLGVTIATIVAAYLSGLACAIHRPLRRLGIGMLIGLTAAFPVTLGLAAAVLAALWGGS